MFDQCERRRVTATSVQRARVFTCGSALLFVATLGVASLAAQNGPQVGFQPQQPAIPIDASGEQIFRAACATCHGADGTGSPSSVVGFDLPLPNGHDFPDFTDCPTNTVEPSGDWIAVVHSGGPVRGLDRHMPAFGDALTDEQIERVVGHVGGLCRESKWPRGDLNLPRPLYTEKAFPENEAVFTTSSPLGGALGVIESVVYEHRLGTRGTYEVNVPLASRQATTGGTWQRGLGDIEVTVRQVVHADHRQGSILAFGGAVTFPTGKEALGLGTGYTVFEPLVFVGQMIGVNGFVQAQAGYEIASDQVRGRNEAFLRSAFGYTIASDEGRGRAWTPMVELLVSAPANRNTQYDIAPQFQVSLSKLQHILFNVGVRVPLNPMGTRKPQLATYLLWDWFDGGLFQFWK
jgi:mono/diheme cytochrome c family protein